MKYNFIEPTKINNYLSVSGVANIIDFGAVGDGVTDNYLAFSNAISSLSNGGVLFIPSGIFRCGSNLIIPEKVKLSSLDGKIKVDYNRVITVKSSIETNTQLFLLASGLYDYSSGEDRGQFNNSNGWNVGTGWTISNGVASHTVGNTGTLSYPACSAVSGGTYLIRYTIGGSPNGGIFVSLGGASGFRQTAPGTYVEILKATSTGALTFTPEINFGGTLDNVEVYCLNSVNFGAGSVEYINPIWFGAVGNDSTDCTLAFNATLECAKTIGYVLIPAGTYRVTHPISNFPKTGRAKDPISAVSFRGVSNSRTVIKYMGSNDGYAIISGRDKCYPLSFSGTEPDLFPAHAVFSDMQVQAPNVNSDGGCIRVSASRQRYERISFKNSPNGTGIRFTRSTVVLYDTGHANDTDIELTSTGSGNSEKIAIKFRMGSSSFNGSYLNVVKLRLKRLGNPTGTLTASIYSDNSGMPGSIIGSPSNNTVNCNSLSTNPDGGEVSFTWTITDSDFTKPVISANVNYWLVLSTSNYTNDANNKVYVRAKSNDTTNGFAVYDYGTGTWTTTNHGSDIELTVKHGQPILVYADTLAFSSQDYGGPKRGIFLEDDAQAIITNCSVYSDIGLTIRGHALLYMRGVEISCGSTGIGITAIGSGTSMFDNCYFEGGGTSGDGYYFDGGFRSFNQITGGWYPSWTRKTKFIMDKSLRYQCPMADDPGFRLDVDWVRLADDPNVLPTTMVLEDDTDGDALGTKRLKATSAYQGTYIWFGIRSNTEEIRQLLPRGTYLFTVYAKQTGSTQNDLIIKSGQYSNFPIAQYYTLTNEYKPYHLILHVPSSFITTTSRALYVYKATSAANTIYISHFEFKYLGPDKASRNDIVLNNIDASDGEGARESSIWFLGRRTAADSNDTTVVSSLARISASHDGTNRDEKGKLRIQVNRGSDKFAPSREISFSSDGTLIADGVYLAGRSAVNSNVYRMAYEILTRCTDPRLLIGWVSPDMTIEPDLSGQGNHGTYYGSPVPNRVQHQVYVFDPDGVNDRVEILDSDSLSFGNGSTDSPVTIGAWVEIKDVGAEKMIISKWNTTSGAEQKEWWFAQVASENIDFRICDQSTNGLRGRATSTPLSLGWHFVVVTYDGSGAITGINFYVDGQPVSAQTSVNSGTYVAMENLSTNVQIGCRQTGSSTYGSFFPGDIAMIFIDGSVISGRVIRELHLLGKAYLGF